jgi:hypothetical protein
VTKHWEEGEEKVLEHQQCLEERKKQAEKLTAK